MVAAFTHANVEAWMFVTCTGTAEGRYPKDAEGDAIGVAIENDFIALTGLAVSSSDAEHMILCGWICEKKYRIWAKNKFFNGDGAGTPGGNVSFVPNFTFTQDQFDAMVARIRGDRQDSDSSMGLVDASSGNEFPEI